jgi:signal transduction histidine kinase
MMRSMGASLRQMSKLDWVLVILFTSLGIVDGVIQYVDDEAGVGIAATPLFLLITLPLIWRRTAPLQASAAVGIGTLIHFAVVPDAVRCGIALPVLFLLAFQDGARLDRQRSFYGLAAVIASAAVACGLDGPDGADIGAMAFIGPLIAVIWGSGRLVRSRVSMAAELQTRTSELKDVRDQRARLEVATDRAKLAGELDDLLRRRLAELARLADDGMRTGSADRLVEIENESRRTLEEMRAVVGVLRSSEDVDAPRTPQPTLTHIDARLLQSKGPGAKLNVEGNARALPAAVELSAYRVVEHLLDALEDADDVEVTVRFADDALELAVTGPARRRGDQAIARATERARLHQGTVAAKTTHGRVEALVSLPVYVAV